MNIEKFTSAAKSVISNAQMIAVKNNHQQILPIHFLSALLETDQVVIANLLVTLGVNMKSINNRTKDELSRIPSVEVQGGGGQISISPDSLKILDKAQVLAKDNNDNFVTIERLFEALNYDKNIVAKVLEEFNIDHKKVAVAILAMRKGRTADSESAEEHYDALLKYDRDVTKLASEGKLDPIIGRDEE
ncbi:MAG: Clp protease N-terminal domain-containing protein, partial [Rickettsiaceae bacterium]